MSRTKHSLRIMFDLHLGDNPVPERKVRHSLSVGTTAGNYIELRVTDWVDEYIEGQDELLPDHLKEGGEGHNAREVCYSLDQQNWVKLEV